jgi:hypothetical protein
VDAIGEALTRLQQQAHRQEISREDYLARREEHRANIAIKAAQMDALAVKRATRTETVREAISLPVAARGRVAITGGKHSAIATAVAEGAGIVERYTHPDYLPAAEAIALPKNRNRSHYMSPAFGRPAGPAIMLRQEPPATTVAHELGHAIEDQFPEILRASLDFLRRRAGTAASRTLRAITGNKYYQANERAWEDEWVKKGGSVYCGKDYSGKATEIITMGIERLHHDPLSFFLQDPDYFEFILITLQKLIP